jgi:hypothetical protein
VKLGEAQGFECLENRSARRSPASSCALPGDRAGIEVSGLTGADRPGTFPSLIRPLSGNLRGQGRLPQLAVLGRIGRLPPAPTAPLSGGVFVCGKAPTTPIISMSISCDPEVRRAVVAAEGSAIFVVAGDGATPSHSTHLRAFFGRRRCLAAKLRRGSPKKLHRVTLNVRGIPVLGIERASNLDRVVLP